MNRRSLTKATTGIALTALITTFGATQFANAANTPMPMASASASKTMAHGAKGDIAFAQMMIPHHQQAIDMADLAMMHAKSPGVMNLAKQIKAAQDPEITKMGGWLTKWGVSESSSSSTSTAKPSSSDPMAGMDMGSHGGPGMMTDADMAKLSAARGAAFDSMWLHMMITHHQGAITDARQVLKTTKDAAVAKMARSIISGQTAQIATMKQMLAK
ncbi:MAG: DUF305 domain-containing protein [Candidatus Nanopelagicales bacterium]|nr:DUF305 domain-containing protein [Candidatus Nanopelagicales bacterium]